MASDKNFYNGHRERLRQKFLDGKLVEYEQLELMLGYIIPRCDVRPLAHSLLKRFGNISQILVAPFEQLLTCDGIGKNTAIFIKLLHQLLIDGYKNAIDTRPIFHNTEILQNYCKLLLNGKNVEECHVLYLDSNYRLIKDVLHSSGTINETNLYPREIIKCALELNAQFFILIHNHPVSDTCFSNADIDLTNKIKILGDELEIVLYDHLLITKNHIYSARDIGLLK